jgi:phosphatidylglycerol:prolipoprotein diacylglycerol transferase
MCPRLFQVGPFTLYSFGLLVVLGFGAGIWLASRLARERGLNGEAFIDGALVILFASILGARLLFVALNWQGYLSHLTDVAALWRGGMSFHGGAIAGILAGVAYMRFRRLPVLAMADAAAPGLALGSAIGRVGCLLNGCCYGGPTTLPWGLHFPGTAPGVAHHPAQIYDGLLNLALAGILVLAYRREHRTGQVLALYVIGYSVTRFLSEVVRKGVTADVMAFGLTQAQVFSIVCLVAGVAWWAWLRQRGKPAPASAPEPVIQPTPV